MVSVRGSFRNPTPNSLFAFNVSTPSRRRLNLFLIMELPALLFFLFTCTITVYAVPIQQATSLSSLEGVPVAPIAFCSSPNISKRAPLTANEVDSLAAALKDILPIPGMPNVAAKDILSLARGVVAPPGTPTSIGDQAMLSVGYWSRACSNR
ncbi:hypothetical protein BKA70DRAFT_1245667 [Coprinopsis sp. MPI-PUGE-AT-0042]|nr:hypothetical protein BKA70DRAFT_1245667 [Coprinopsis sp. MPI-PUGE-AT-0042]